MKSDVEGTAKNVAERTIAMAKSVERQVSIKKNHSMPYFFIDFV